MKFVILLIFFVLANVLFAAKRLLRYLQFLQQEGYDLKRFVKWFWKQKAWDRRASSIAILATVFIFFGASDLLVSYVAIFSLLVLTSKEEDPRREGKLCLEMTPRATRIYLFSLVMSLIGAVAIAKNLSKDVLGLWCAQIALIQSIPLSLVISTFFLSFDEFWRQRVYLREAKGIIKQHNPYVIGITGSYGKTSTKDALGHLLQETVGPTFWPVKGINTPMGITREIRTRFQKGMEYAVIEMGAYGIGSIRRLCELTPPHAAIITGIGTAHLERFGSEETILKAKSELAQAVPYDGILVCNGDNAGARKIAEKEKKKTTLLYGKDLALGPLDCWISSFATTAEGTSFTFHWKDGEYSGFAPLFGFPALSNLAAAFTMACALGANPEYAVAVFRHLKPVDNRLEVKKASAITFIKDAYNSNPIGFAAALSVMSSLPGKRRIIMTPGFIELGQQQQSQNIAIAKQCASVCDYAIIVGKTNSEALLKGLQLGGMPSQRIVECPSREDAFKKLEEIMQEEDIILIENDLPDLYERKARF